MTFLDTRPFQPASRMAKGPARQFVFLLLPTYSPLDVSIAIETLSEANAAGATPSYTWRVHSETGQPLRSHSGVSIAVDGGLDDIDMSATILLCGGNRMEAPASRAVINLLRKAARHGATLGSFGSGCAILAQAGLLPEKKIAAHWAISTAIQETFPEIDVCEQVYEAKGKAMTCAGGLATLDMFLALISEHQGVECAHDAAAALVCSNIRDQENEQTLSLSCRLGSQSEHLIAAVELMKDTLEHPLPSAEIAQRVGVSGRQLERLFAKHLGMSPKSYNDKLRLERARRLLQQTNMTPLEIAVANGFTSTTHFSKLYRKRFGASPYAERGVPTC
ncbi:GlxA family transcriptional regulator [Aliiroseovarius marinus]|uniref:GlxA family transcriptional regulator n=1 Tax=Aliiroseovarius marinus TaxID=2500159 RepID=UPI002495524F|nr:helix-turn-helix domain-containing protein [Aliiroseovarius marinus]